MWFIFGIITLTIFTTHYYKKRFRSSWKGETYKSDKLTFQYKVTRGKQAVITGLLVGIDGSKAHDFKFKKESAFDRFFKWIRLSKEYQTGNQEFDSLIYMVTDNEQFHEAIATNPYLIETVLKIIKSGDDFSCEAEELINNSGRLWIKYKLKGNDFNENHFPAKLLNIAGLLDTVASELNNIPNQSANQWKDPFAVKAAILLSISTALAINGYWHFMRISVSNIPFTLDMGELFINAIIIGAGITLLLLITALTLLGRSSRTHLVVIELLFVGAIGSVLTTYAIIRDINIEFDQSTSTTYETKALFKEHETSGRSSNYYLYLEDWNNEYAEKKVRVSRNIYDSVSIGDTVKIKQKPGYLNLRWVESLKKK